MNIKNTKFLSENNLSLDFRGNLIQVKDAEIVLFECKAEDLDDSIESFEEYIDESLDLFNNDYTQIKYDNGLYCLWDNDKACFICWENTKYKLLKHIRKIFTIFNVDGVIFKDYKNENQSRD